MKLLSRENGQFPFHKTPSFTLYPDHPGAFVRLDISRETLLFLLQSIDWTLLPGSSFDLMNRFVNLCEESGEGSSVIVPYNLAIVAVKTLLNIGITQYEILE